MVGVGCVEAMADIWVKIKKGQHKSSCEDAVLVGPKILEPGFHHFDEDLPGFLAVADGVGGNNGAKEAAYFVLRHVISSYHPGFTREDLINSIVAIDSLLIDYSSHVPEKENMATTLTLVIIEKDYALYAQVGNTRLWEIRGDDLRQVSRDQSAVQICLDQGDPAEASRHAPSELMGFMGGGDVCGIAFLKVGCLWQGNDRPDYLLLTSDGIHDHIEPGVFRNIVLANRNLPNRLFQFLYSEAEKNLSMDDKSVLIINLKE